MVGLGVLMIGARPLRPVAALARPALRRRWFHRAASLMGPLGFVAVLAGWITTEVGRQPWVVYGLLRTADARLAASPAPASAPRSLAFRGRLLRRVRRRRSFYMLRLMAQAAGPRRARRPPPRRAAGSHAGGSRGAAGRSRRAGAEPMSIDLPLVWAVIIAFARVHLCRCSTASISASASCSRSLRSRRRPRPR